MMIHDPRIGGLATRRGSSPCSGRRTSRTSSSLSSSTPLGTITSRSITESVRRWSIEVTIETADEKLRKLDCLKFPVSNTRVEETVSSASSHGCAKLDLFFMVGIPHQTYEDAMATVPYCESLIRRFGADPRLQFFVSPMGPFLDPGCGAFEDPKYGYRHFYRTLEEHRQALLQPTWKSILSYETDAMRRDEIDSRQLRRGRRSQRTEAQVRARRRRDVHQVKEHQAAARSAMEAMETAISSSPKSDRRPLPGSRSGEGGERGHSVQEGGAGLGDGQRPEGQHGPRPHDVPGLAEELDHGVHRLFGMYDTAVFKGERIPLQAMTMEAFRGAQRPAVKRASNLTSEDGFGRVIDPVQKQRRSRKTPCRFPGIPERQDGRGRPRDSPRWSHSRQ